jgi:benzoate/toluate 1,2-dioxygenase alpha subunit
VFLDLVADQGAEGVELLPGTHSYTFNANWKLQIENCVDAYHLTSTHPSYIEIVDRRKRGESQNAMASVDFALYKSDQAVRGSFCFPHGYNVLWGANPAYRARPLFLSIDDLIRRTGEVRTRWMLSMRNLTLFPNAQFAENASLQLRVLRPIAVDKTEMTTWCVAPKGESAAARRLRLRQYEDFFNASGLATPDDSIAFEDCQMGYQSRSQPWQQGYVRGIGRLKHGGNAHSAELGVTPLTSVEGPFDVQDETIFHSIYREWLRLIEAGLQRADKPRGAAPQPEAAE